MNEINRRELMQSAGVLGASAIGANQFIDTVKAQSDGPTNEISGVVETESGPLENATVVAVPHDTSQPVLETTTDSNGEYIFTESDLIEGDNLYIVVAYAGTESTPLRSEQNYPFVVANGGFAIPDSGVFRYEFEQDVTDSWNNNDGVDNTSAGYVSGKLGSYAKGFDGVDDYVNTTVGDSTIVGLGEITVTAWVNPDTAPSGNNAFVSNTSENNALVTLRERNGSLQWGVNTDTDAWNGGPFGDSLSTGTYQFVAGVYSNSDGEWRIHQGADATQVNSGSHSGLLSRQGSTDHTAKIGANGTGASSFYEGAIDDPRLYTSALGQSQLQNVASGDTV